MTTGCSPTSDRTTAPRPEQDEAVSALARAPVIRSCACGSTTSASSARSFSAGRWRPPWAGSILELNPFDQPDVEASKRATRRLIDSYEKTGQASEPAVLAETDGLTLYADDATAEALRTCDG